MGHPDLWSDAFLAAFLVGLLSTMAMFLMGALHGAGAHASHGAGHGHGASHAGGHVHGAGHGHGAHAHGGASHAAAGEGEGAAPPGLRVGALVNVPSLLALAMCGGAGGYLALRLGGGHALALAIAAAAGFAGALLMAFVLRALARAEAGVVTAFDAVGTVARVIAPVGPSRVGEVAFTRDGARHAFPARLDDEAGRATTPLERDVEVVILRVEHGTAYVRPTDELFAAPASAAPTPVAQEK